MMIAIDGNTKLVYEGQSNYGYGLWPTPVLSMATLLDSEFDFSQLPIGSDLLNASIVFREDSFDPVTRIRRGRLYKTPGTQPQTWRVHLHANVQGPGPMVSTPLHGFDSNYLSSERHKFNGALIALGCADAYTLWRVVGVERIVTGEDLLTLRARSALGTLPELNESAVPEGALNKAKEALSKLSDAAYRAGPESIVDRARDVAQWCTGSWLAAIKDAPAMRHADLGQLWSKVPEEYSIIRAVVGALARLHSRVKPNEQDRHGTRVVSEDDAEFALASVGILLREIGWAT